MLIVPKLVLEPLLKEEYGVRGSIGSKSLLMRRYNMIYKIIGAGYLLSEGNVKSYCFSHNWFNEGKAPYKVFEVATHKEVLPDE